MYQLNKYCIGLQTLYIDNKMSYIEQITNLIFLFVKYLDGEKVPMRFLLFVMNVKIISLRLLCQK